MRIQTLRQAGAKEVHMVVSCPPHRYPCYYGIDFSTKGELIACQNTVDEIKDFIGVDSLYYLSMQGMLDATCIPRTIFVWPVSTGITPLSLEKIFQSTAWSKPRGMASARRTAGSAIPGPGRERPHRHLVTL